MTFPVTFNVPVLVMLTPTAVEFVPPVMFPTMLAELPLVSAEVTQLVDDVLPP